MAVLEHALSHDLEGSIRGLGGLARILLQKHGDLLDSEASELAKLIVYEASRSAMLVSGLQDWLHCSHQPLDFGWQDATALARGAFARVRPTDRSREVEFHLSDLPPLWADRTTLSKIFTELLANAVKFTAGRSPAVISVISENREGEPTIIVKDNGTGFEMKYAGQLFRLFRQLHPKREFGGVGMGLAVVQRIIERHGGRIWVEAEIGQGAAFHFTLARPVDDLSGAGPEEGSSP
jgi:light-regulated signal transduction histidine kinase (bacteriophytochrome)